MSEWKHIPIPVYNIASGYFARCDGVERCFPRHSDKFRTHKMFPGAVFFAPYGFSWKKSFATEWSAVSSLCQFLAKSAKASDAAFNPVVARPKKVEPGLWVILATNLHESRSPTA